MRVYLGCARLVTQQPVGGARQDASLGGAVSISEFVRLPAAAGLRRAQAPATAVRAARAGPAPAPAPAVPVLHLACAFTAERADGLAAAVLARLARSRRKAGTVVLDLGSGTDLDGRAAEALCALRAALRERGTDLRLVVASREARAALAAAPEHRFGPVAVHECARAALLAAFALAPGPGLVDGTVRAALAAPPDAL
jgi:anti-anti-sigma regulatory factor